MNRIAVLLLLVFGLCMSAAGQTGKITGKLTYPGEGIPADLLVCVATTGVQYCSNDRAASLLTARIAFKVRRGAALYEITLPPGTYHVFAMTSEMPGVKAYYDEFVRCGMSVNCTSKKPIPIRVKAGQVTKGITLGDFW